MTGSAAASPKALVVGPSFFGYEHDIVGELSRHGFDATFLDERPSNSSWTRAAIRVRRSLLKRRIDAHFREALSDLQGQDLALVVVIKAESTPRWFVEQLRASNPSARFVLYLYDSLANSPNCLDLADCFDERLSFDRDDVDDRPEFDYLPLFYTPDFSTGDGGGASAQRRYHLSFVGTLHSRRFEFVRSVVKGSRGPNFLFFYVQARWYFAVMKYVARRFRGVRWSDVSFVPMSRSNIASVFRDSTAVLDLQRDGQAGMTMRTFEVLASGAALVTTNSAVCREPFYDPERVIVISEDLAGSDLASLPERLDRLSALGHPPIGFEAYSLSSWAGRIVAGPGVDDEPQSQL